jgi:hypothetical protein
MWTGTVWIKYIFKVMQQRLNLQGQLPQNWDFLKPQVVGPDFIEVMWKKPH